MCFDNQAIDCRPCDSRETKKGKFLHLAKDKKMECIIIAQSVPGPPKAVKENRATAVFLRSAESEWETEWRMDLLAPYLGAVNTISEDKFDQLIVKMELLFRELGLKKESLGKWVLKYDQSKATKKLRKMKIPKDDNDPDASGSDSSDGERKRKRKLLLVVMVVVCRSLRI